jgi:hypothetical protein
MHNQRIRYLLMMSAGGLIGLLSLARVTHAETYIRDGYIYSNTTWTESGSPYIVEDTVTIPGGTILSVDPGVSIVSTSALEGYGLFNVSGTLLLNGKADKRINITGVDGMSVSGGGLLKINYSDINLPGGIANYGSSLDILGSTISDAEVGISVRSGVLSVTDSKIHKNNIGIVVEKPDQGGIFPVLNEDENNGRGGEGNAFLAQTGGKSSSVIINNSSLVDNLNGSIKNDDTSYVKADQNWWGSENGPSMFSANRISGLVHYVPWLDRDPSLPLENPGCCSSIVFIPGLKGTRLYREEKLLVASSTNRLWEPNVGSDVKKLYLDNTGISLNKTIYSGEVLGRALTIKDIYGEFVDYLENLKGDGVVNEWKAFGYDWRKPINEVVAGREKKATTTESLLDVVYRLAENSKTGKVTLIAHSNGGLVAKYLVKVLTDLGKEDLIDSVISVAVPYLGTPEAIGALLHGSGQSIAKGIILNQSIARGLGINMPSAYSLLPSREYFSKIFGPTIAFASTTVVGVNNGSYPKEITTYQGQASFLTDRENDRSIPKLEEVNKPTRANSRLMTSADLLHGMIDSFVWPSAISRWSILGWGIDTVKNIVYSEKTNCKKTKCKEVPVFETGKTIMGDGTVVAPSAVFNSGTAVSLDLNVISKQEKRDIEHGNILGASSTMGVIDDIINSNRDGDKNKIIEKISKIPGVSIGEPDYSKEKISLVLSTHSPVELHVYDSEGNHTGLIPKPEGSEDVEDGLYTFFDENIKGSSFETYPDGFGGDDSYIYLPDDNGMKYTVVIDGNGFGEFTYKVTRVRGDTKLDAVEYVGIPVTPFTIASTTVITRNSENSELPVLASSPPEIKIDFDGNGSVDVVATTTTIIGPAEYHKSLRSIISSLIGNTKRSKDILKRVDRLDELLKKGKFKQVRDLSEKLEKRFGHKKFSKVSEKERAQILDVIENYIKQYE